MSERSVWIVEAGDYSDYRVVGIYSTRENAQAVADYLNGPGRRPHAWATRYEYSVLERELDPGVDGIRAGLTLLWLEMGKDGAVLRHHEADVTAGIEDETRFRRLSNPQEPPVFALHTQVWARDLEHAVKVANERRLRLIAEGRWPGGEP